MSQSDSEYDWESNNDQQSRTKSDKSVSQPKTPKTQYIDVILKNLSEQDITLIKGTLHSKFPQVEYKQKQNSEFVENANEFQFQSKDLELNCKTIKKMLKCIQAQNKDDKLTVYILAHNYEIQYIIGSQGKQINKLMKRTKTHVIVNNPIYGLDQRTVQITGFYDDIADCIQEINQLLGDIDPKQQQASNKQIDINEFDISDKENKIRLILENQVCQYLNVKRKKYLQSLQQRYNCKIYFKPRSRHDRSEQICEITGALKNTQAIFTVFLTLVDEFLNRDEQLRLSILIPKKFVTPLIGLHGSTMKDLTNKAGNPKIQILSNPVQKTNSQETQIAISGPVQKQISAIYLISGRILILQNGGEIKYSEKTIQKDQIVKNFDSVYQNMFQPKQQQVVINDMKIELKSQKLNNYNKSTKIQIICPKEISKFISKQGTQFLDEMAQKSQTSIKIVDENKIQIKGNIKNNTEAFDLLQNFVIQLKKSK